jgi:hypothetical protein
LDSRSEAATRRTFPRLAELDPHELGVRPSKYDDPSRGGLGPYIPRDVDSEITEVLRSGKLLLLQGPAASGKTRTAYEAARNVLGNPFVIRPLDLVGPYPEIPRDPTAPGYLLWLDDIASWLEGRLVVESGNLLSWAEMSPGLRTVATIDEQRLEELERAGPQRFPLLARSHRIQLNMTLSPGEQARARELYPHEEFTGPLGEALRAQPAAAEVQEEGQAEGRRASWYLPSPRIATDIWTIEDQLGYNLFTDALTRFLLHEQTVPPITIAIKGPWGSGKTSLMRMVRERIDPHPEAPFATLVASRPVQLDELTNREVLKGGWKRPASASQGASPERFQIGAPTGADSETWRPTVWFNPWIRQAIELPWAGLAHEIVAQVMDRVDSGARERFWLDVREDKNASHHPPPAIAHKLRRALIEELLPALGAGVVGLLAAASFLGLSRTLPQATAALETLSAGTAVVTTGGVFGLAYRWARRFLSQNTSTSTGDVAELVQTPDYHSSFGPLQLLHGDLRRVVDLVATEHRPLVVFVDDLDRCSAPILRQVIEGINLFLAGGFGSCIFIMAIEPDIVAEQIGLWNPGDSSASSFRSDQIERGWRFLDKVVQLPLSLPKPDSAQVDQYVRSLLGGVGMTEPLNEQLVESVKERIQERAPDVTGIRAAAIEAQEAVAGLKPERRLLSREAEVAAQDIFADWFRDEAPVVQETVRHYASFLNNNPRAIKRFMNLLRFYSFIAAGLSLREEADPDIQQGGKLAILTIRWPHLLTEFAKGEPGEETVLESLERLARVKEALADSEKWDVGTKEFRLNLNRRDSEDLRALLAADPSVGGVARMIL